MAAGGHFGCPKITFDRISGHSRSIGHLDFRNSLLMAFLAIQIHTELNLIFDKMAARGHFGCPQITFNYRTRPIYLDE